MFSEHENCINYPEIPASPDVQSHGQPQPGPVAYQGQPFTQGQLSIQGQPQPYGQPGDEHGQVNEISRAPEHLIQGPLLSPEYDRMLGPEVPRLGLVPYYATGPEFKTDFDSFEPSRAAQNWSPPHNEKLRHSGRPSMPPPAAPIPSPRNPFSTGRFNCAVRIDVPGYPFSYQFCTQAPWERRLELLVFQINEGRLEHGTFFREDGMLIIPFCDEPCCRELRVNWQLLHPNIQHEHPNIQQTQQNKKTLIYCGPVQPALQQPNYF